MFVKENSSETTKKSKKSKKMEPEKCQKCSEVLDLDDLNFQPCPCGYKICLFCWNQIIETENEPECPMCYKKYSESPVKFEPPTAEQLQKLKNKKKQEDVKKKQKLAEDRKQLADVRVVRKNLIFINELPLNFNKDARLYQRFLTVFKQAGLIRKTTVLNSSKNYAGQKAPYARAYVTYQKNEEALKALKLLENVEFEGRELKICLGTTKYCSNFIKNVKCTNKECVYLHEQAEAEASFTKEQIHVGKHIEYGQKLYNLYIQSVNNMHTKSNTNQITEERKSEFQSQITEESDKEIINENSTLASTSQQSIMKLHDDKFLSPTNSDEAKTPKPLEDLVKAITDMSKLPQSMQNQLIPDYSDFRVMMESISPSVDSNSVNKGAKLDNKHHGFDEKFVVKRESGIPNGFHEGSSSVSMRDPLLPRLNTASHNSTNESSIQHSTHSIRSPYRNEIVPHSHVNNDIQISQNLESRDDCGLDFDPVQMALGGLGELVVSEKQKARIEVNSLNATPVNAFKKQMTHQQPIFSPNNVLQTANAYQNKSQGSPSLEYYNQSPYNRPPVQCPVPRSTLHSQSTQRFANAPLTIQLPRYPLSMPVTSSMANGYSPQQFMPQISPQDPFMMPHQQSQNFENYPQQHFSNFDQVTPPQVFSVNNLQNQSVRDSPNSYREWQQQQQRLKNETIGRPFQQQSYQPPLLQRFPSFCNSTPQGESLPRKGNNTFP